MPAAELSIQISGACELVQVVSRRQAATWKASISKSSAAASYVGGHMRKLAIGIGIIIAVVILVVVALAAFFNPNKYRRAIQAELERRLDRKVTLGTMHLGFFPPRFQVENLS